MTELVKAKSNLPANVEQYYDTSSMDGDLTAGVSAGYPIVSIRGSKWRIKAKGEETLVTNEEGEPKATLEVIILKANKEVSKVFYENGYVEGSDAPPDCSSSNGTHPDSNVQNKQHDNCANCPHNQWGSRITKQGKKGKSCQDSRRLAVVPAYDIENKNLGGPMLLRVPAASLTDLAKYGAGMQAKGFPYNSVITKIGFDPETSHPQLTFKPARVLTDAEKILAAKHYEGPEVARVLDQDSISVPSTAAVSSTVSLEFDDEPEAPAKPAIAKKKAAPAEPVAVKEEEKDELDDMLDDMLKDM